MKRRCSGLLLMATLASVAGCDTSRADLTRPPALPPVSVVRPRRADAVRSITLPGDLVGFYEAALHAKVSGYLTSVAVDKGDAVRRGQVLAEIEVPELEQKLKRARANREIRRLTQERLQHVWATDKRLVAREDVDIAESQYQQAQAEVEELEAMMSYTHIVAPFDGVITGRFFDPGALIDAGGSPATSGGSAAKGANQPVLAMADLNRLRVYVYVPENEAGVVREGQRATLTLEEFPGRTFHGTVARFSRSLDLATRTMLTEVDLDNPTQELYPGMYADVRLDLARHAAALELPSTSIGAAAGGGSFVYVVRDGRLDAVAVQVGIADEGWVEVTTGIADGDDVVRNIAPTLHEGESVQPLLASDEEAAPEPARRGA